jgi:cysteine-rich repeat protein
VPDLSVRRHHSRMRRSLVRICVVLLVGLVVPVACGRSGVGVVRRDAGVVVCGDGKLTGSEACDDGNSDSYDGCSLPVPSSSATSAPRPAGPVCMFRLPMVGGSGPGLRVGVSGSVSGSDQRFAVGVGGWRERERFAGRGSRVAGRGSRVAGRGSRVAGRGSRVAGRGSRVAGRGSHTPSLTPPAIRSFATRPRTRSRYRSRPRPRYRPRPRPRTRSRYRPRPRPRPRPRQTRTLRARAARRTC